METRNGWIISRIISIQHTLFLYPMAIKTMTQALHKAML
uniref:Uncharacterized protein n=1 Tax=Setaria italica TaxID=4555 RepID=K3ZPJ2_SETIT